MRRVENEHAPGTFGFGRQSTNRAFHPGADDPFAGRAHDDEEGRYIHRPEHCEKAHHRELLINRDPAIRGNRTVERQRAVSPRNVVSARTADMAELLKLFYRTMAAPADTKEQSCSFKYRTEPYPYASFFPLF